MSVYKPEGSLIETVENKLCLRKLSTLREAMYQGKILEGRALVCDSAHNLIVDLGCCHGIIPRAQAAIGIEEGSVRDISIISRVGKPVCFMVTGFERDSSGNTCAILSRRMAQELCRKNYVSALCPGDIIPAKITHMEHFGCFVDIGCGITSLVPIDCISISRISHPGDRFRCGQEIRAVIKSIEPNGRITLSHKELLGTWEENAAAFSPGETVAGIVRSMEKYGVFVELTPNLAGLAEPREGVRAGQYASVYIKSLLPEKMKVKLIIVDAFDSGYPPRKPDYYISQGRLSCWRYSPASCVRVIETVFG